MSQSQNSNREQTEDALRAIETFWHVRLPSAFRKLYTDYAPPFLAPCEFHSAESIAAGEGREFGMLPQYLPFGRAMGDGGSFGFYITPDSAPGRWPVLYWDEDEMFLRPAATDFEAFLCYCILSARYETEEQWSAENGDREEEARQREIARCFGLKSEALFGSPPRSDSELYERVIALDPQNATSLCHVGCLHRARGDAERALDFFHRAGESAPWFGDACYLVADIYRERRKPERAVVGWWEVAQRLLPLCTRTWQWDLGAEHPEADIYEVAADGLMQHDKSATSEMKNNPLWDAVVKEDPYDPDVRESLGSALFRRNDLAGAEREYLNALSLCNTEKGKQPIRLYNALIELYESTGRSRDAALAAYDSKLPRSIL